MSLKSMLQHFAIFVLIELIFVLIVFRELPETSLYTLIGVLHLSYWIIVLAAGWLRSRTTKVRQRFLCTYVPVLYHLAIHIYAGMEAMHLHDHGHHDEHSTIWMIVSAGLLGVLIWGGERYLHRAVHCQTHHAHTHQHCEDDCEQKHK